MKSAKNSLSKNLIIIIKIFQTFLLFMRKKFFYRTASVATTLALVATTLMPGVALAEVAPLSNPALGDACGLDIMLVLDRSGSIDTTEMTQLKDAAKLFVDAFLPSTPTLMGVVSFSTT